MHFITATTLLIASLAHSALAETKTSLKDVVLADWHEQVWQKASICDKISLTADVSSHNTDDKIYAGIAYGTTLDGDYSILTNGTEQTVYSFPDEKFLTYSQYFKIGLEQYDKTSPILDSEDDFYIFAVYTINFPLDVETKITAKDKKITNKEKTSLDVTSDQVFLSTEFPPKDSDVNGGDTDYDQKVYKVQHSC